MATGGTVKGIITTSNEAQAFIRPDIDPLLYILEPWRTPFTQWLYFSSETAHIVTDVTGKFQHGEDEFYPHLLNVAAAFTGGAPTGTITLTDASSLAGGEQVFLEDSGQQVWVTAAPTGNNVPIASVDGSNLLAVGANTGFRIVGSFVGETEQPRIATSTLPTMLYNYLTIFSETVEMTGREEAGQKWTNGLTFQERLEKRIKEVKIQMEQFFLLSTARTVTNAPVGAGGASDRVTVGYGLKGLITSNVTSYSGALTEAALDAYFMQIFNHGGPVKHHYCGWGQLSQINAILKAKYQVNTVPSRIYGSDLQEYIVPGGKILLIPDPVLDGPKLTYWGVTVDPDSVRLREMAPDETGSRAFRIEDEIKTPGVGGSKAKILADVGIEVMNQEKCGWLLGA